MERTNVNHTKNSHGVVDSEPNSVIEGLRGMAALMVLTHHYAYALPTEWDASWSCMHFFHNGVDLFFVITGFLFAPYLLGDVSLNVRKFAVRRAFRLYPLYLISLSVSAAFVAVSGGAVGWTFLWHVLFVQTLPIFTLQEAGAFSLLYWTLPVEVAFYALIVLIHIALFRHRSADGTGLSKQLFLLLAGVMSLIAFLASYYVLRDDKSPQWVLRQGQLPAMLLEFWFGVVLYWLLPQLRQVKFAGAIMLTCAISLLAALMAYYALADWQGMTARPFGWFNVGSALAYALLMGVALLWGGATARGFRLSVLQWLGSVSYAVYLFHEWVLRAVQQIFLGADAGYVVVLALLITLLLAGFLHVRIEAPLRSLGRRLSAAAA